MSGTCPWGGAPLQVWIAGTDIQGGSAVSVSNFPATQAVSGTVNATCSGTVNVGNFPSGFQAQVINFPATQAVSGTFWPATQPISGAVSVSNFPVTQPVSGTFWQATQPVSLAASVAVTGAFFQATQPVSATALPLPTGASTEATLALIKAKTDNLDVALSTRAVTGLTDAQLRASAVPVSVAALPSTLVISTTAAVNTALTASLPAVAGQFHYITSIQITKLYAVVGVASGAGIIVTSTNLPGSPAFTTEQLASAAGTATRVVDLNLTGNPLKSSVANTATTIVCPQQLQTIWRINVTYYTGT